jgi:putative flippase GtrA
MFAPPPDDMDSVATTAPSRRLRRLVHRLVPPTWRRFIKFGVVGGSGVFVNIAVAVLFERVLLGGLAPIAVPWIGDFEPAASIGMLAGIVVSIFTNFIINDRWTWGDRDKGQGQLAWARRCRDFYVTNGVAAGLQFAISSFARHLHIFSFSVFGFDVTRFEPHLAILLGIAIATPINFLVNHYWTFRDR